ncbi:MAG: hypothetical protein L3K03_00125 [Thermoplasmata archaeon]|nr:hypothetical protein [Thermoplasmata archaeon]
MSPNEPPAKKTAISLTPGSKVRVHSAGSRDQPMVTDGLFRGLVSVGGDNSIALEMESGDKDDKGKVRLVPLNAVMAIDILVAAKAEEEKRPDSSNAAAGYFR